MNSRTETPDSPVSKTADQSPLILKVQDAVACLIFNRPGALNAINLAMALAFRDAMAQVAADPSIRVLVIKGQGRAFMAGGDVAELAADPLNNVPAIIQPMHQGLAQMAELPMPVLAGLHGAVAGGGMSLALAADLALASDNLRMQMAYSRIGASPDVSGSWHLARLVGLRKAMELTLLSDTLDAQQALALGLVNWVVPAEEFESRLDQLARRLAGGPVGAYGRSKALLRAATLRSLPEQLDAERDAFMAGAGTAEFHEGTQAFLQKRAPDFAGVGLKQPNEKR